MREDPPFQEAAPLASEHSFAAGHWELLDTALADALDLPEPDRLAFLEERLGTYPELFQEGQRLLRRAAEAEAFFAQRLAFSPAQGATLGSWQLERELGRGGSSVVWLAHRRDGKAEMRAAIKMLQTPFASPALVERFDREKQILASLQHPNIAHLLDASIGPRDLPNFAMEFVDGLPLPEHCSRYQLSLTARVRLARQLLDGLQYAHSKLVVHRDLKPGNIFCTSSGIPKLLDFGIARLLESQDLLPQTETIYRALSVDYASPEQLRGEAPSTATDIYSMGLVLYETFTGERARRWNQRAITEILRDCDVFRLPAHPPLPRDLYAILGKATDPDPSRRYASASEFAADLGRFLDGLPVSARKAGLAYVAMRYARRHAVVVTAIAITLAAILGGSTAALYQARQAEQQRQLAVARQAEAERAAAEAMQAREQAQVSQTRAEEMRSLSEERREDLLRLSYSFLEDTYRDIATLPGATPVRAQLLERTLSHLDRLEASNPEDPNLLVVLIDALGNLADTYGGQNSNLGEKPRAESLLVRREALIERLAALMPGSLDVARMRLDNRTRLIPIRFQGNDERRKQIASLEPRVDALLRTAEPSRALYRFAVSYYFQRAFFQEDSSERLRYYQRVLALATEDERRFGGDEVCWRSIAIAHKYAAGSMLPEAPDYNRHAQLAVTYDEKRVAQSPMNATARMDLSFSRSTLAGSLEVTGQWTEAVAMYQDVLRLRLNLLEMDPGNQWYLNSLWYPLLRSLFLQFQHAERDILQQGIADLSGMARRYPPPPAAQATLALMKGEITHDGDAAAACAAYREADRIRQTVPSTQFRYFFYLDILKARIAACVPESQ